MFLNRISTAVLLTCLLLINASLVFTLGLYAIKPAWQAFRLHEQQAHAFIHQVQLTHASIAQLPRLKALLQHEQGLIPTNDINQQIAMAALNQQIFISILTQSDATHLQATLLGSFTHLNAFLQQLTNQASLWSIQRLQFTKSAVPGSPLSLQITWQKSLPEWLLTTCRLTLPSERDPFQPLKDGQSVLNRYPLAQIEWLGLFQDQSHRAALIRLPDQHIYLVNIGDNLGFERWRLTHLTSTQADFLDAKLQPQHLLWQPEVAHG